MKQSIKSRTIKQHINAFALLFLGNLALLISPNHVFGQLNREQPKVLQSVGIDEHLGETIPLDARFATSNGDSVTIGELLEEGKPVLLNPLYYNCPMLCSLVIDGILDATNELAWSPGKEYIIISFSIDANETHNMAADYKNRYISKLNKPNANEGWYFLTGRQSEIDKIISSIGFGVNEIEETGEFAHAAAIVLLSPDGVITRYLYGIKYNEFDLRSALFEAADGNIGSTLNKVLMYCFQYDSDSNSYVPVAVNIMKLGGLATLIILGIFIGLLWLRERDKNKTSNIDYQ
jgi:protein SCO1/2